MASESDWAIKGKYFESCTCDLVCPCIFLRPPTKGYCEALVGWHIEKGHMADVDLSELNVAAWLHAPGLLTDGGWRLALYLDERADEKQQAALSKIYGGEVGGHPAVLASLVGDLMGVRTAPIEFREEPDGTRVLRIAGVGENITKTVEGEDGGRVTVANHPLAVAPGFAVEVCASVNAQYKDYDVDWTQSERVGLASPFSYHP